MAHLLGGAALRGKVLCVGCVLLGCPAAKYVLVVSAVRPPPSPYNHMDFSLVSLLLRTLCLFLSLCCLLICMDPAGGCGWGGYPQDDSSIRWGSPQGRGFVCGLCSAGLPCCQVCTSCLWGPPSPPLLIIMWISLLSPLFCGLCVSPYAVSSFAQILWVDAGGGLSLGWLIY